MIPDGLPPDGLPHLSYGPEIGWDRLRKAVLSEIAEREQDMTGARLPDFPSYCEAVGYLRGLRRVLTIEKEMQDGAGA